MKFKEKFITYDSESNSDLYTITLTDDIKSVGRVDFLKTNNIVLIAFIFVEELSRRKGYATKMLCELNSKYNIKWDGRFTEIGRKFYENFYKTNKRGSEICHTYVDEQLY